MGDVIDQGFRQVAALAEFIDRGGAVALGELVPVLAEHHRQVAEFGHLPAEGVVHYSVKRRGGYPLLRPHDLGYSHEVVIDDIGEMIGREAVRFEEHRVGTNVLVLPLDRAEKLVVEDGRTLQGNFEAYDIALAFGEAAVDLFLGEIPAVPIVALVAGFRGRLRLAQLLEPLLVAEAIIGLVHGHELFGVFLIGGEALGLDIGTERAAFVGAFVPIEAKPGEGVVEVFDVFVRVAGSVGIFQPEDEGSAGGASVEVVDEGRANPADMLVSRG